MRHARHLLILLVCLLLASCASSRRMMRVSPFGGDEGGLPDADRVNLWPGLYHTGEQTSVAWPIVDIDGEGFAVRPLINKDGDDWSILFPLSAWNPKEEAGWVLTGYWFDDEFGIFPLFHRGEDFDYIGPFWKSEDSKGVFPLFSTGEFNHVAMVYWVRDDDGAVYKRGLFPLYKRSDYAEGVTHSALLDLIHFESNKRGHENWIIPFWLDRQQDEHHSRAILPFFWREVDREGWHNFTLLGDWYEEGDRRGRNLYPLWFSDENGDDRNRLLLPLYYYQKEGARKHLITPLFGRGWHENGETFMTNIAGPLYHHVAEGDERYTAFIWPLFQHEVDADYSRTTVLPVFDLEREPERSIADILLLGQIRKEPEGDSKLLWPLLSLSERNRGLPWRYKLTLAGAMGDETDSTHHLAGPFGFSLTKSKDDNGQSWKSNFLLLMGAGKASYQKDPIPHAPGEWQSCIARSHLRLFAYSSTREHFQVWKEDGELSEDELKLLSAWSQRWDSNPKRSGRDIPRSLEILKKVGISDVEPNAVSIKAAVRKYAESASEERQTLRVNLPMLFTYRQSGSGTEWDALFSAANYQREKERTRLSILRYLFHRQRQGEQVTRDIFPFIKWDSSPDSAHYAFLWRLASYSRDGDARSGHLFFVPWGKQK
jgi:hypothetical protein